MWRAPYIVILTFILAAVIWFASWVGLFDTNAAAAAHDPGAAASQSSQSETKDIDRRLANPRVRAIWGPVRIRRTEHEKLGVLIENTELS